MDERTENFLIFAFQVAIAVAISGVSFFLLNHPAIGSPLGPDEAVYLSKARTWLEGTPSDQWRLYRPIGMSILGWALLHFSDTEYFIRTFGAVLGVVTSTIIFLFFRKLTTLWIAICVIAVVMTSPLFLLQAPQFLNDIPSSGLMIALLWSIYSFYKSNGTSNVIYFAGPLTALTFYMRYGAVQSLAMITICTVIILAPKLLRDASTHYEKLAISVFIAALLLTPHFIYSYLVNNNFLGILTSAGDAAHRAYIGEGLVQYITWLPDKIGGWPLGITAILGAVITVYALFVKSLREKYIGLFWVGMIGLSTFLTAGILVHAEPRYVFFPMVLLAGTGIAGVYYAVNDWSKMAASAFAAVFLGGMLFFAAIQYNAINTVFQTGATAQARAAYMAALATIRRDSANTTGCAIWSANIPALNFPRASWYARCNVFAVINEKRFHADFDNRRDDADYVIIGTKLKETQITEETAPSYRVLLREIFRAQDLSIGDLVVYRLYNWNDVHIVPPRLSS